MKNENQDNKNPSQSKFAFWTLRRAIVVFVVGVFAAAFLYPLFVREIVAKFFGKFDSFHWEKYGQFGDSFGFVTAIFACAAFFLLLKTYKAQKKELRATRKIMANQSSVMSMQKFETTFFNIFNLYSNLSDGFIASKGDWRGELLRGNAAFRRIAHGLTSVWIDQNGLHLSYTGYKWSQEILAFGQQYKIFIALLDFCFNNCPSAMREQYLRIISSTLVDGEVIMLVVNCYVENNSNNKKLLNGYFFEDGFYKLSLPEDIIDGFHSLLKSDAPEI